MVSTHLLESVRVLVFVAGCCGWDNLLCYVSRDKGRTNANDDHCLLRKRKRDEQREMNNGNVLSSAHKTRLSHLSTGQDINNITSHLHSRITRRLVTSFAINKSTVSTKCTRHQKRSSDSSWQVRTHTGMCSTSPAMASAHQVWRRKSTMTRTSWQSDPSWTPLSTKPIGAAFWPRRSGALRTHPSQWHCTHLTRKRRPLRYNSKIGEASGIGESAIETEGFVTSDIVRSSELG